MTPGYKVMLFIAFMFTGAALGSVLGLILAAVFMGVPIEELTSLISNPSAENAHILMWINNAAQVGTFLVPVLLALILFGHETISSVKKFPTILVVAAPAIVFSASALIDMMAKFNKWIIPEGSVLESWFKPAEEAAEKMVQILLGSGADNHLPLAFFSIAILPAICEELVFRGVLQPLISKVARNQHIGIWISAAIFSTIHFQFYGFIPRLFLGAILGYLVFWSGSLWPAIVAHFANNALAFSMFRYYGVTETPEDSIQGAWYFGLSATLLFGALIYWYYRTGKSQGHLTDYTS